MTKISDLTALTGAGVDTAADLIPIVDMSLAGTSRNKKILVSELGNALAAALAYTNEQAQDAVGGMVDASLTYVDATPLLQRAALTGDVTASAGSNATTIANNAVSFAKFVAAPSMGVVWAGGAANYAHNASGGGSTNFLRADGTWAAPPGTGGSFTAASTTEVLTGTDSSKGGTPDSIAALWEQGSDVASSGTISIGEGGYFNITGTTTITDIDFATDKAGRKAYVKFAGALTLTHNASTLILPTGANITTAAGDTACFISEGSDVVRCVSYQRADGTALASAASSVWALAGTGQTATGVWDQAVDGSKANVDFVGLAGKTDILIVVKAVTKANSGLTQLQVSVDNGSTFYSASGDYTSMAAAGGETNTTAVFFHGTAATLARTGVARINGANLAIPARLIEQLNNGDAHRLFVASSSAINAVRINGSSGGNLTGGKIYCFAR